MGSLFVCINIAGHGLYGDTLDWLATDVYRVDEIGAAIYVIPVDTVPIQLTFRKHPILTAAYEVFLKIFRRDYVVNEQKFQLQ